MADRMRVRGVSRGKWDFSWQSWHEKCRSGGGARGKKKTGALMLRHSGEADKRTSDALDRDGDG